MTLCTELCFQCEHPDIEIYTIFFLYMPFLSIFILRHKLLYLYAIKLIMSFMSIVRTRPKEKRLDFN